MPTSTSTLLNNISLNRTAKPKSYTLPPTPLIPNSPHPLLHYPSLLLPIVSDPKFTCTTLYDLYRSNGWTPQWVARYGATQPSHYHSTAHEVMVVIAGEGATIRFGVADQDATCPSQSSPSTHEKGDDEHGENDAGAHEPGGITLTARKGDVFIVPAGVAHKTYDPRPGPPRPIAFFQCKDEDGNVIREEGKARAFFAGVETGREFMMMGAYPDGDEWDFKVGGEHAGREREVWGLPIPEKDPVLGIDREGLVGLWKGGGRA